MAMTCEFCVRQHEGECPVIDTVADHVHLLLYGARLKDVEPKRAAKSREHAVTTIRSYLETVPSYVPLVARVRALEAAIGDAVTELTRREPTTDYDKEAALVKLTLALGEASEPESADVSSAGDSGSGAEPSEAAHHLAVHIWEIQHPAGGRTPYDQRMRIASVAIDAFAAAAVARAKG